MLNDVMAENGGAIVNFKSFMADSGEANWNNVRNYMGMMTHLYMTSRSKNVQYCQHATL